MIEMEGARLHPVHNRHATVTPNSRSFVIAFAHPVFVVWSQEAGSVTGCRLRIRAGLLAEIVESWRTQRRAAPVPAVFLQLPRRPGSWRRTYKHRAMPSTKRWPNQVALLLPLPASVPYGRR